MNPIVKKITDWLSETIIACFIEIILQAFLYNWNLFIEAFNLNLRTFNIEDLFKVTNVCDAATSYDVNDFMEELTYDLIVLDDPKSNSQENVHDFPMSEYSISKDDFTTQEDSLFWNKLIELNENDDAERCETFNELHIQCESISNKYIDESMVLVCDSIKDFQEQSFYKSHRLYPECDELFPGFDESFNLERNVADDNQLVRIKSHVGSLNEDNAREVHNEKLILLSSQTIMNM